MGIFGITCLLVLVNYVFDKPVNHLLKIIGDVNWKEKASVLWENSSHTQRRLDVLRQNQC